MTYLDLLTILNQNKEDDFAEFQRKLIPTKQTFLGVRTPTMRKIAKSFKGSVEELLSFPDEFYEVTFIKLTVVSALSYEQFIKHVETCVALIDNWATCDCFKAKCILKNRECFLPMLLKFAQSQSEFSQRYALVTLLNAYIAEEYETLIKECLFKADCSFFYVHMAAAWLTAEILIQRYEYGVSILKERILPTKTHNKAIQKAVESFRLTKAQKDALRSLKIKNQ